MHGRYAWNDLGTPTIVTLKPALHFTPESNDLVTITIYKDWKRVTLSLLKSGHRLPNLAVHSDFLDPWGARGILDEEGDKACKIYVDDRNAFLTSVPLALLSMC